MFHSWSPNPVGGAAAWEAAVGGAATPTWGPAIWLVGMVSAPQSVAGPVVSTHCWREEEREGGREGGERRGKRGKGEEGEK